MPLPKRFVEGTYTNNDGSPKTGYIEFTPSRDLLYHDNITGKNEQILAQTQTAYLNATGSFSIELYITDSVDLVFPYTWLVDEKIENERAWCLCVPASGMTLHIEAVYFNAQATTCAPCAIATSGA